MKIAIKYILPFLILINSIFSINQWSSIPVSNTFLNWVINFFIIGIILSFRNKYFNPNNTQDYLIVKLYFVWILTCITRGLFVPENYWEWKQLIEGSIILSLPLLVYVFSTPSILKIILKYWLKIALSLFLLIIFIIPSGVYHYYLGPVLLLACFLPILNRKWQALFVVLLLIMIFSDFGARSQVIKSIFAILISIAYITGRYISTQVLKIAHWMFYIIPIVLLFLGLSGSYNPFEALGKNEGKYIERKIVNGKKTEEDLSIDTRSFIYQEVIASAIKHNYALWGRTPARGNDSVAFGSFNAEDLKTGKYERHSNEICFPNVFTWTGIIGMILYCLIYLKSSYLAVYRSNNLFIKLLGVYIAFHFLFGWIEDFNRFDIANISLWMMISMGFSEKFRKMNNAQFKYWVKSLFN